MPSLVVGKGGRERHESYLDRVTCWIIEKARELKKKSSSALLTIPKPLTVWITTNWGKSLKRWEYQTT